MTRLLPDWWSQDYANIAKWMADGIRQVGMVKFTKCNDGYEYACYRHDKVSLNLVVILFKSIDGWKMNTLAYAGMSRNNGNFRTVSTIDNADLQQAKAEATRIALNILDYMASQTGKEQQS